MKHLFNKLVNSFDTINAGFSARKLTAFAFVCMIAWCHYNYVTATNVVEVIMVDASCVFLLLGIVTVQQLIRFKNGNQPPLSE